MRAGVAPAAAARRNPNWTERETGRVGHRVSCPEFVGRAEELEALGAALDRAAGGTSATVLVGGDAGIGKTRLVDELCTRARDAGSLVARGVCVPLEGGGLPYGPVVGVLRDILRQRGVSAEAAPLAPLAAVGGGHPGPRRPAGDGRGRRAAR